MKVTANIATYPPRAASLKKMLKSIEGQFDEIRIYDNGVKPNLTDNGKFYALDHITEPEYYFTLDDDLIYPPNYVDATIKAIKRYGCIVTHHGRILNGEGLDYYHAHQYHACTGNVHKSVMIDVCGTGVTAFDTRYFHPKGIANDPRQRMTDLLFSLQAAEQKKVIGLPAHNIGWIKGIENNETIFDTEVKNGIPVQNKLADKIWRLRYQQQ